MAKNDKDLIETSRLSCKTLQELDSFITRNHIERTHPDIAIRHSEILAQQISNDDVSRLIRACCKTRFVSQ